MQIEDLLATKPMYALQFTQSVSAVELIKTLVHDFDYECAARLMDKLLHKTALIVAGVDCESDLPGIDIELERSGIRYLIAAKSDKNCFNSSLLKKQRQQFMAAMRVRQQSHSVGQLQPTLGICYGKFKTVNNGLYLHIGGQSFWELISGEPDLYKDIIEPVGYRARELNDEFAERKAEALTRMTGNFISQFCTASGAIDWPKVVELVSRNM